MLKRVREKKLDFCDVRALKQKLAIEFPTSGALNIIIMIQKNKTYHFINYLQIKKFAYINNWDIIIFREKYYQSKKDANNMT